MIHDQRVLFLTSGMTAPATQYRILPYFPRLQSAGIQCDAWHSIPQKYHRFPWLGWWISNRIRKGIRRIQLLQARWRRYDAIVLEREIFDDPTWNYEAAFRLCTPRLILDVDDAVFLRYPEKFIRLAKMSDHVVAGNRMLAQEFQKHCPNVTIIPTAIDLNEYPPLGEKAVQEIPVIGWIGTPANLPYLNVALPALKRLAQTRRFRLRIITSDEHDLRVLNFETIPVEFRRWSASTAVREIQQFDIGIMPLPDEPWERCKCGFKLLQYMAAGVPAIASPVGVNAEMISHGKDGFLAETTRNWDDCFHQILSHPEELFALRQAARDKIESRYSIDVQLPNFLSAITGNAMPS